MRGGPRIRGKKRIERNTVDTGTREAEARWKRVERGWSSGAEGTRLNSSGFILLGRSS